MAEPTPWPVRTSRTWPAAAPLAMPPRSTACPASGRETAVPLHPGQVPGEREEGVQLRLRGDTVDSSALAPGGAEAPGVHHRGHHRVERHAALPGGPVRLLQQGGGVRVHLHGRAGTGGGVEPGHIALRAGPGPELVQPVHLLLGGYQGGGVPAVVEGDAPSRCPWRRSSGTRAPARSRRGGERRRRKGSARFIRTLTVQVFFPLYHTHLGKTTCGEKRGQRGKEGDFYGCKTGAFLIKWHPLDWPRLTGSGL